MPQSLVQIKTFPQLLKYLEEELDWPVDEMEIDDLTFEYDAEEDLGLDPKTAANVRSIRQLRQIDKDQPFGIFFVEFEPKTLPVTALRRILGALVTRKRASANPTDRKTWKQDDLIFVSAYGEDEERRIDFAHFSDDAARGLPTLRVLGWDADDTPLAQKWVEDTLRQKLLWPEDETTDEWRLRWREAFVLRHREAITTSKQLAIRLAKLAQDIRKRVNAAIKVESAKGPLRTLMTAFKQALIHDLDSDDFADMYAQTIAYGLLSARVSRPAGVHKGNIVDMVPITNPFLKELLETFLNVGGRKYSSEKGRIVGIDFDELGVNDVVDVLNDANMEAVLRDFDNRNPQEDPVIHFYELFLKEYDAKKRMQRGVFYTPKPVVSYIVRSVHELLQTEFGLPDGLADTTTWGEMIKRFNRAVIPARLLPVIPAQAGIQSPASGSAGEGQGGGLRLPEIETTNPKTNRIERTPIDPSTPFVQILDPATGTATFLVEVIDVVHKTMLARWKKEGHGDLWINQKWNEYVPRHLLPRLHGYELMMAPYAIAHMKIGLKLFETGYTFGSGERARIYLTNALEPPQDFSDTFEQMAPALAHEAKAVNDVKRHQRFTVVIGNPPYAGHSANVSKDSDGNLTFIGRLIEDYKSGCPELFKPAQAKWLHDDYVKFLRFDQWLIAQTGSGIVGVITNHGYIDNPTFRGMRRDLKSLFTHLRAIDLHGSSKKKEKSLTGDAEENVFDIQQGVAICLATTSTTDPARRGVFHADVWGSRESKYARLSSHSLSAANIVLGPLNNLAQPPGDESVEVYGGMGRPEQE